MGLPIENEKELAIGGFQGIKKVRGLLVSIDVQDPPESWERPKDDSPLRQVVKVDMEDAVVLEMFGDEEPMDLKDGKFNFYIPYTAGGKNPHKNSIYSKCWLESAKELGKKPSEFIGQYVTLEKQPRLLFEKYVIDPETKQAQIDENGDKMSEPVLAVNEAGLPNHFCFVKDEEATSENIKDYVKGIVVGLNQKAALRKLLIDPKAKVLGDYKARLNDGTLAEYLGLVVDAKGIFQEVVIETKPVETVEEKPKKKGKAKKNESQL